ncbi:hypothetical protein, partial, partial [Absidia glauca]
MSFDDFMSRHLSGRLMFYGYILTDGISINFVFARLPSPTRLELYVPDMDNSHRTIEGRFGITGLDPGRRDIVTTAGGAGTGLFHNRQVSTKEFKTISGETKRRQYLEIEKSTTITRSNEGTNISFDNFESALPTLQSANVDTIRQSIQARLSSAPQLMDFYGISHSRRRLKAYS